MGANAQKEVSNSQIGEWLRQTIVGKIFGGSWEAILGMVNSQEDPTVEQMIVECQKENPNEKEEIAKIGEALTLEIENRKEKLESGVGDITHTFSDNVPEKDFYRRVKVETQEKQSKQENQKSVHKQVKADSDYQKEIGN